MCKNAAGPGVSGTFAFDVGGRTVSVPVGACAQPLEVPAGTITVTEHARPGMVVTDISTFPSGRTISRDVGSRSITVAVAAGDVSTQTVVTFANAFEIGQLKVCKVAGPGVAGGSAFHFTAAGQAFTVPAGAAPGGFCRLAGDFPAGTSVTVNELAAAGTEVSSIAVAPAGRLTGQPDVAARTVAVAVGPGVTEVTFTNRALQPPVSTTTTAVPPTTTTTVPPVAPTTTSVPGTSPQVTTTTTLAPGGPTTTSSAPPTTTTTLPPVGPTTTSVPGTFPPAATTTTTLAPGGPTTTVPGGAATTTVPGGGPTTTVPGGAATTTVAGPGAPTAPTPTLPRGKRAVARPLALTGDPSARLVVLASTAILLGCALVLVSRLPLRRRVSVLAVAPDDPVDEFERALADPLFLPAPRALALTLAGGAPVGSPLAYRRFCPRATRAWDVTRTAALRE